MTNDLRDHRPSDTSGDLYAAADTDTRLAFDELRQHGIEYQTKPPRGYIGRHRHPDDR